MSKFPSSTLEVHMTVEDRKVFQQSQVEKFCSRYDYGKDSSKLNLERHMLLHIEAKTLYCFAPKVRSLNLKNLFYFSQVYIGTGLPFLSKVEIVRTIVRTYFKFIMYRNPVERLISAYRSKVEMYPLQGLLYNVPHYNWIRSKIYKYKHSKEYRRWRDSGGKAKVQIGFDDFIDYWLTGRLDFDEHFQTIFNPCQPYHIGYDFYGNFDTFESDASVLIKQINSDSIFLRNGYYNNGEQTSAVAPKYYEQISERKKKLIIFKLARDLSFYYSIFPSQKDSHKSIMHIDFNIPSFRK